MKMSSTVIDTVEDNGLEAIESSCPLLEELRVFPADCEGVTKSGFLVVSRGCRNLHYALYFFQRMTNAVVVSIVQNCPYFTHFHLCIMTPAQPDYLTNEPMDEAFGVVVKNCTKLRRLSVSGCPKLRKLQIRDCPFGNVALLSGREKYKMVQSLSMSTYHVTMTVCKLPAMEMPRVNVEVIREERSDEDQAEKVYVYRSVVGPRQDAPPFVLTL
ncbi:hypothetical protein C2S52_010349 [Perilla frutescens var. hirtella]|nr:hypothetical protein C2S52_010349 [Perilla frutescens var. hirtella]